MISVVAVAVGLTWERLDQKDKSSLFHAAQSATRLVPPGLRESVRPLLQADSTMHSETAEAVIALAIREMGI